MRALDRATTREMELSMKWITLATGASTRLWIAVAVATLATLLSAACLVTPARADFGLIPDSFTADAVDENGAADVRAGGHPHGGQSSFLFGEVALAPPYTGFAPDGRMRDVEVTLPPGFVGNPRAAPVCPRPKLDALVEYGGTENFCPSGSQVGIASVHVQSSAAAPSFLVPIYNMTPRRGEPAAFGMPVLGVVVSIVPRVDPARGYRIVASARAIPEGVVARGQDLTLWGVPSDPVHDTDRFCGFGGGTIVDPPGCPVGGEPIPFLTNPTSCGQPQTSLFAARSWERPDVWVTDEYTTPQTTSGCERVPFDPTIEVSLGSHRPDAPTGFDLDLSIPQSQDPDGIATGHLKRARVTLPEGMTVNPASADGLAACSDADLGLGTEDALTCPSASKIGSVTATTPLLAETLAGGVYLRPQASSDPASGDLFRIALVLENEERGISVRLPGSVEVDPSSGQVVTEFDNNPQLPVEDVRVSLKDGPRAPLATPSTCGTKTVTAELESWSGKTVTRTSTFEVACGGQGGFFPAFATGTENPLAQVFSPFAMTLKRNDGEQELRTLENVQLPEGLLGKVAGVPVCGEADAAAGTCPAGSRIGRVEVAAGAGISPLWVPQAGKRPTSASLAGPYRGAPYSLSVAIPAQAGPYDLGRVVVRNPLHVDPETARLSTGIGESRLYDVDGSLEQTIEGAMPTVVKGLPLRLREIRVLVDRPGFTFNPTDCSEQATRATVGSAQGQRVAVSDRFQVGDCSGLRFTPKLAMRLSGKKQTKTGGHPALAATVAQGKGQANISEAKVTLPRSVVLDPLNTADPKMLCDYDASLKADCPATSVIGKATAVTPVLNKPLSGDVHMVQGIRFENGNRIRTTPSLLVKLRGEVAINLRARTTTERGTNRLVTTFGSVPDAPVSKFAMKIAGGKKGILVVTRTARRKLNLCSSSQVANAELDGHNGKEADFATRIKTPCGAKAARNAKKAKRSKAKRAGGRG